MTSSRSRPIEPADARQFAVEVVRILRDAGHQALWAGGCVRDDLVGLIPKDYDIATDAVPERVREILGRRRTIAVGAAFGVITVLGPKHAGQLDVATFRRDVSYTDGRRPDQVVYSTAEEDAQRRDFTVNGLFFDPLAREVIDYVGGQDDLQNRILRAIGDANTRFEEDKLRMLRAVRFAAAYELQIEPATLRAIRAQARELTIVSAERIASEMRRILEHSTRSRGLELLRATELLAALMPESETLLDDVQVWQRLLGTLNRLQQPEFPTALAVVVRYLAPSELATSEFAAQLGFRWKLTNHEREQLHWLLLHEPLVRTAPDQPWPAVQRILAADHTTALLQYVEAITSVEDGNSAGVDYCRRRIAGPVDSWNPPPLITGKELLALGLRPGPLIKQVLDHLRDAQLDDVIQTPEEAIGMARTLIEGKLN